MRPMMVKTHLWRMHLFHHPPASFFLSSNTSYPLLGISDYCSSFNPISDYASDPTLFLRHRKNCVHRPIRKNLSPAQKCVTHGYPLRSYNFSAAVTFSVLSLRRNLFSALHCHLDRPAQDNHSDSLPSRVLTISDRIGFPDPSWWKATCCTSQ